MSLWWAVGVVFHICNTYECHEYVWTTCPWCSIRNHQFSLLNNCDGTITWPCVYEYSHFLLKS